MNTNPQKKSTYLKAEKKPDPSELVYGKVAPQAVPLEEAVIGALLVDKNAISAVIEVLRPESFYKTAHHHIYEVMMELFEASVPIDLLTVPEKLKKKGVLEVVGGINYILDLTNKVASAANVEHHARIIAQKYIQRQLIEVSTRTISDSYEDQKDVFDLLNDAEQSLYDITDKSLSNGYERVGTLAVKSKKERELMAERGDDITGVPTGYKDLDKLLSGWQDSALNIIAARPGMGKTAFTLSLAMNAAEKGHGVAVFSLEMSKRELVKRLLSMTGEINSYKLNSGKMTKEEWKVHNAAVERLADTPLYIDDTPALNIFELRAKSRRLKQNHDIKLIIVDYLQLMQGPPSQNRSNREQEISAISRSLKGLAKELDVPVIALSQLSRAVETRGGNKKPVLSDLRESGAIEQDADIVTFIYRADYYELADDFDTAQDEAEIIVSKHRNGALGSVYLKFVKEYVKFTEADPRDRFVDPLERGNLKPLDATVIKPRRNEGDVPF